MPLSSLNDLDLGFQTTLSTLKLLLIGMRCCLPWLYSSPNNRVKLSESTSRSFERGAGMDFLESSCDTIVDNLQAAKITFFAVDFDVRHQNKYSVNKITYCVAHTG